MLQNESLTYYWSFAVGHTSSKTHSKGSFHTCIKYITMDKPFIDCRLYLSSQQKEGCATTAQPMPIPIYEQQINDGCVYRLRRKLTKNLNQCFVHLVRSALKELPTAGNKQSVSWTITKHQKRGGEKIRYQAWMLVLHWQATQQQAHLSVCLSRKPNHTK